MQDNYVVVYSMRARAIAGRPAVPEGRLPRWALHQMGMTASMSSRAITALRGQLEVFRHHAAWEEYPWGEET